MAVLSLLHIVVLMIIICSSNAETQRHRIAKSGCDEQCGGVLIPYPFGVGDRKCYLNPDFEVTCNKTSDGNYKPFLKRIGMELLTISLSGDVNVNNRVFFSNCNDISDSPTKINISGTSFTYSDLWNRFTVVGCDTNATLRHQNGSYFGACLSACSDSKIDGCYGLGCCQIDLPLPINFFEVNMNNILRNRDSSNCGAAFISSNSDGFMLEEAKKMKYVEATLTWGDLNGECDIDNVSLCANGACWKEMDEDNFCVCGDQFLTGGICNKSEWRKCVETLTGCLRITLNTIGNRSRPQQCPPDYVLYNGETCRYIKKHVKSSSQLKFVLIGCGSGLGLLSLLIAVWCLYKFKKHREAMKLKQKFFKQNGGLLLQQQLSSTETNIQQTKVFNSVELEKATDNFHVDRILGRGGQGTVYKGMLTDGSIVAIKKSKAVDEHKLDQFINEVVILSQINHRNVVKLIGCCMETEVPLLVYEFIPNGTLSHHLHHPDEDFPLTWEIRLKIAVEVSSALSYMHSSASSPIYHRDIKSSNILLDDNYRAKVSDFGTSKSVCVDQTHVTTRVQGTFGYLDPEYYQSNQFTEKSDVYSFGVLLVELLTGRKPTSKIQQDEDMSLVSYFLELMEENLLFEIIDKQIVKESIKEDIMGVSNIAMRCLCMEGKRRPTMLAIAMELEDIKASREAVTTNEEDYEEADYQELETKLQPVNSFSTESQLDGSL